MVQQSELLKINKNEYLAQQKSKVEDALDVNQFSKKLQN